MYLVALESAKYDSSLLANATLALYQGRDTNFVEASRERLSSLKWEMSMSLELPAFAFTDCLFASCNSVSPYGHTVLTIFLHQL